jgi:GNAT superfamily N-acetyltransferase
MRTGLREILIRKLTVRDIPAITTLSSLAGWNQTAADWSLLLQLHAEGCLGIEIAGEVVATATLICYGDEIAWLGMVLTHPNWRRRGFARHLVESALALAAAKEMKSVKLDATEQGQPLYESLGFRREQNVERWSRHGSAGRGMGGATSVATTDFTLDREAFGADRSELLKLLAEGGRCLVSEDGFVMWRPGIHAASLGPCVARSSKDARLLIGSALSERDCEWFWDLLPANQDAVRLAVEFGFRPARRLVRMVKGQDIRGKESMIYAGGGFELG